MNKQTQVHSPFRVGDAWGPGTLRRASGRALEWISGLHRLDRLYRDFPETRSPGEFAQRVLELFDISVDSALQEEHRIPAEGGAVIIANHPFGALEGVILTALLTRVRSDVRFLANHFLQRVPELANLFIGVDPFSGPGAVQRNTRPLRQAVKWVRDGGLLVVFPAGEVSHPARPGAPPTDPAWSPTIAGLIRLAGAPVLPFHFSGGNSVLFYGAGMLHPRLRTLLLPRELINKTGARIGLRIGPAIGFSRLQSLDDDEAMIQYLRSQTYALAEDRCGAKPPKAARTTEPLADPVPVGLLQSEVEHLPAEQRLHGTGELSVHYARAEQIPWLLQELGRLRELTFRGSGEGTGRARDIDLYDAYYLHLFIWNRETHEVVGAYRLGLADEILARFGKNGLYTHSLFRYRTRLLQQLNPAVELGRSFVRPEYQRSYSPLLLLWKGIGEFIAQRPRYRVLFGPASISNDYESQSQRLLVEFLRANNYAADLARLVRPRRPFRTDLGAGGEAVGSRPATDLDEVSRLVARIEPDGKGVPILLKQYLKLGGELLGFNVDPDFNDALDGLIMVDLAHTDPRVLAKYMGADNAAAFLQRHLSSSRQAG